MPCKRIPGGFLCCDSETPDDGQWHKLTGYMEAIMHKCEVCPMCGNFEMIEGKKRRYRCEQHVPRAKKEGTT